MKLDLLCRHAADLGIEVEHADLGPTRRGDWCEATRTIRLNSRLTRAQAAATCAHELAHALGIVSETHADELGAALIIARAEYAAAEAEVGEHPAALAATLGVTPRLVLAWRRWHTRKAAVERVAEVYLRAWSPIGGVGRLPCAEDHDSQVVSASRSASNSNAARALGSVSVWS